jgi:RimJ/RimL family protein N-acetyltransferase
MRSSGSESVHPERSDNRMAYVEALRIPLVDRSGPHLFSIRLLHEFGQGDGYLNPQKVSELWGSFKSNPVIFTDEIDGSFEAFFDVIMNPRTIWHEIYDEIDREAKGVFCLSNIIPGYDAVGHFAYWDRVARGRDILSLLMMSQAFERFSLHRMTAEIPSYQSGTIRAAERIGLKKEGVKREAVRRRGKWVDLVILGITEDELKEALDGQTNGKNWNTSGD